MKEVVPVDKVPVSGVGMNYSRNEAINFPYYHIKAIALCQELCSTAN